MSMYHSEDVPVWDSLLEQRVFDLKNFFICFVNGEMLQLILNRCKCTADLGQSNETSFFYHSDH